MKEKGAEIKKQIRTRFGSVRRFCRLFTKSENGKEVPYFNYQFLMKALSGKFSEEKFNFVIFPVESLIRDIEADYSNRIDDSDREFIRMKILLNYRNVRTFAALHEEFNSVFIHNVISGKRKKRDLRFLNLKEILSHEDLK
jgi:hypothetical protein